MKNTPSPLADASSADRTAPEPRAWAVLEVVFLLLMFFLFAASPPPDVGEAHYLAKAKHYWNPTWAAGDLFLDSADAHLVFNWTFGWVTKFVSLPATAWIGRGITWLLLAWAWRRLSWAVAPVPLASLLSAGLMLLLAKHFHMAGEWIVGGVEAKGIAYVFVFLALESLLRERWRCATLLGGSATAFHVLVGGWTLVALAAVWLASPRKRLPLMHLAPALIGAVVLALPGLVPAVLLTRGADPEVLAEANQIYVFERLSHHLVFHSFEHIYMLRHALLLAVWCGLAWATWQTDSLRRLHWFVIAAIGLALIGIVVDQGLLWRRAMAASLLRYYWFRLEDSLLPVATALLATREILRCRIESPRLANGLLVLAMLAAGLNLADICHQRAKLRLPGSFLQPRPTMSPSGQASAAVQKRVFADWLVATEWVRDHTPAGSRLLTPRRQQTFKWYAERAEVANWKDVPQDSAALVRWGGAFDEIYPNGSGTLDLAVHTDDELLQLARKYDADYLLLDRRRAGRRLSWPRVYPTFEGINESYEVYRVPPP